MLELDSLGPFRGYSVHPDDASSSSNPSFVFQPVQGYLDRLATFLALLVEWINNYAIPVSGDALEAAKSLVAPGIPLSRPADYQLRIQRLLSCITVPTLMILGE